MIIYIYLGWSYVLHFLNQSSSDSNHHSSKSKFILNLWIESWHPMIQTMTFYEYIHEVFVFFIEKLSKLTLFFAHHIYHLILFHIFFIYSLITLFFSPTKRKTSLSLKVIVKIENSTRKVVLSELEGAKFWSWCNIKDQGKSKGFFLSKVLGRWVSRSTRFKEPEGISYLIEGCSW
jgi:hypothetical protein